MLQALVQQRGVMAVSWQSSTVLFQGQDIQSSTKHGKGQLCAGKDITGSESGPIMVCLMSENFAGAALKVRVEAYLFGFSKKV